MAFNTRHDRIRRVLLESSIGSMCAKDIAKRLDMELVKVHGALREMPDVYIKSWKKAPGGTAWTALYAAVVVPPDAPRPSKYVALKSRSCNAPVKAQPEPAPAQEEYRPRTVWVTT
jgi:hypothetical protein